MLEICYCSEVFKVKESCSYIGHEEVWRKGGLSVLCQKSWPSAPA